MKTKTLPMNGKWVRTGLGLILLCLFMLGVKPANAFVNSGLFLSLENEPDIFSDGIAVNYDASTQLFTASGFAEDITTGGSSHDIDSGAFFIEAIIDNAGEWHSGSLTIEGTIPDLGFDSPPTPNVLLAGDLAKFGSVNDSNQPQNDELNFVFDNLSGDAASLYNGTAGVILTNTGALGGLASAVFSQSFANNGQGFADTGAQQVPEPGTLILILSGGFLLLSRRLRSVPMHQTNSYSLT